MSAEHHTPQADIDSLLTAPLRVERYDTVTSTNTLAKERAAQGEREGLVILATQQTAGRGRQDRRFYSPADTGLYLSILLRPALPATQTTLLTTAAAVAVVRAVRDTLGLQCGIKWVNDILLNGRKVCGILTESALAGGTMAYAVVGIGINVFAPHGGFPSELADIAGALCDDAPTDELRSRLAAAVLDRFWELYTALPSRDFMHEYRRLSVAIGQTVTVCGGNDTQRANVTGIDDDGRLLVRYDSGETASLGSGEIRITL